MGNSSKTPAQSGNPEPSLKRTNKVHTAGLDAEGDDGLTQSERFIKAAQELGTDDDPERFAERVRKLGSATRSVPAKEARKSE